MDAMMGVMVDNLTSDRADRFDQGCREAAALIEMLQNSSSFPASAGSSYLVIENLLASVGRILEESLKYPNDVARHHALRSVAAALTQALVPTSSQNKGGGANNADASPTTTLNELKQKRNNMEKMININSVHNDILDWDAAVLASESSLLATSTSHNLATSFLQKGEKTVNPEINTLSSLLQLSLHVPSLDTISGKPSMFLKTAQQVHFLSSLPPSGNTTKISKHSLAGLTAYLTLHPQALYQLLTNVLSHAATSASATIEASIDSNTEWKSNIEAIAASPALHLAARSILRAWLATSGNINIWLLHYHLFKLSSSDCSNTGKIFPEYLYPGNLESTADRVFEASLYLESIKEKEEKSGGGENENKENIKVILTVLGASLQSIKKQFMNEDLFSLLLDGLQLTKAALQQLSWTEERKERNRDDDAGNIEMVEKNDAKYIFKSPVPLEVAEWVALVMWPFNPSQQRLMCVAMTLNENGSVDGSKTSLEVKQSIAILQNTWCPVLLD